jgi:cytoskeletal protein RodZ
MSETIGQQLKQAREARNLTLKKVTQETHIQTHLLEAMEADDFESLPSPVQAHAFLRIYAEFLELSLDELIARHRTGIDESPNASHPEEQIPGQNQKLEDSRANATIAESSVEPRKGKSLPIQVRIRRLFSHDQQNLAQPQTSSAPVESVEQVESVGTDVEEPALNNVEEIISAGPDSSNHPESQVIFSRIGEALRQRRETISLTLDEIENHTHVRKHYLRALEEGDFDHLPSSVQARGMLNNYAHFLDLDVDAILMQYAEGLQIQRLERQPPQVEKKRNSNGRSSSEPNIPTGIRRYFSLDFIFGVGLILTLFVIAIWGTSRVVELRAATTPQPSAQSISDILVASPEVGIATPTIPTEEIGVGVVIPTASSAVIVTLPATGQGPVKVIIIALGQAFR